MYMRILDSRLERPGICCTIQVKIQYSSIDQDKDFTLISTKFVGILSTTILYDTAVTDEAPKHVNINNQSPAI